MGRSAVMKLVYELDHFYTFFHGMKATNIAILSDRLSVIY